MRVTLALCLTLTSLAFGPVLAQETARPEEARPAELVMRKMKLAHLKPEECLKLLTSARVPEGVQGILTYPIDNSLIARGTPGALSAMERGVRIVDVQVTELPNGAARTSLHPGRVSGETLRTRLLALPEAGAATWYDGVLALEGKRAWVRATIRRAMQLEMEVAPAPQAPAPSEPG